ncbi:MAG TPA: OadG family protein [Bacillota bacterium]|nr:OadG family protein [Bacillota bacterium]
MNQLILLDTLDWTVKDAVINALICVILVFSVLFIIAFILTIVSKIMQAFTGNDSKKTVSDTPATVASDDMPASTAGNEEIFSSGTLRLKNVDEPTAAMIMAIVSDESGIPLEELCFKSIALVESK